MARSATRDQRKWLLKQPDPEAESLIFCFPYAGVGASSYRGWPAMIGTSAPCALQPPGRENRFNEPPYESHADFAADCGALIAEQVEDRPFAFFAHCGGVPFALETVLWLAAHDRPLPTTLIASAWGPPHTDLYGHLNKIDLDNHDLVTEIQQLQASMGFADMPRELAGIGARVLHQELVVHRPWRYDPQHRIPVPVISLAWSEDDTVPTAQAHDPAWRECGEVGFVRLPGDHMAFVGCPPALADVLSTAVDHRVLT
ncbi:thioesterase II family protein [Microlunatus soli]|uniref:Surfactin synthase thioesterase subunit n=1 Tax=Microlunatus soli TaxID=630515 RepID=A0A1H1VTC4_9ACTN|nr:thioesterase domain-containing protein [Microlunatus soli]SDS88013.1 Surfactin synthase thioesterase subunit [Microlunatus soli]